MLIHSIDESSRSLIKLKKNAQQREILFKIFAVAGNGNRVFVAYQIFSPND